MLQDRVRRNDKKKSRWTNYTGVPADRGDFREECSAERRSEARGYMLLEEIRTLVINKRNLTFRDESPNGFWGIKNGRWKFTLFALVYTNPPPPRCLGYIVLEGGGGVWGLRVRNPPPPFPSTQSLDPRILAMCSRWFGNLGIFTLSLSWHKSYDFIIFGLLMWYINF